MPPPGDRTCYTCGSNSDKQPGRHTFFQEVASSTKCNFFNYYVLVAKQLIERAPGQVLTIGQGDVGQLGLGPDRLECTRPARVQGLSDIVYMCAGGMHTVCLDVHGQVSPAFCKHLNWIRA